MTRRMAGTDENIVTATYTSVVGAVLATIVLPIYWVAPANWGRRWRAPDCC